MIFKKKKDTKNKKKKKKHTKKSLSQRHFFTLYLNKAGISTSFIQIRKYLLIASGAISIALWLYFIIKSIVLGLFSLVYMIVMIVSLPLLFMGVLAVVTVAFIIYIDVRIYRRKVAIELVLPDFLQLASANIRSGMTIDRALWSAIRPQFGVLAKEMEMVAKQTMSGEELDKALIEFGKKYDSPVLTRTIQLIVEGLSAGGELGDLLERISLNLAKSQGLQMEMAANVTSYVMFITFATIVAAPVLYGLSLQMINITTSVIGSMNIESTASSSMPISIGGGTSIAKGDFIKFAIMAISVTSFFSACIVSMIKKGNIKSGLKLIPAFITISLILFFIASWVLGMMFSGVF